MNSGASGFFFSEFLQKLSDSSVESARDGRIGRFLIVNSASQSAKGFGRRFDCGANRDVVQIPVLSLKSQNGPRKARDHRPALVDEILAYGNITIGIFLGGKG